MVHRHHQEAGVVSVESELHIVNEVEDHIALVRADGPFGLSCGSRCVHEGPGVLGPHTHMRFLCRGH